VWGIGWAILGVPRACVFDYGPRVRSIGEDFGVLEIVHQVPVELEQDRERDGVP